MASRRSQLAMTQTQWVISSLKETYPDLSFEIVPVTTRGDKILDVTLSKVGGKGLFVSEIEEILLNKEADMAVHSLKDLPYELSDGLELAGIPKEEDARDAWISKSGTSLKDLKPAAVVGTASLRRAAQILWHRPDVVIEPLRGNIDTRLRRAANGDFAAIVLAASGLHRMGWQARITEYLSPEICLPAVGQGILGVECRANDDALRLALETWTDAKTQRRAQAERAFLRTLEGSCQVPIAALAQIDEYSDTIEMVGLVADPGGQEVIKDRCTGDNPLEVGTDLAKRLLDLGAKTILRNALAEDSIDGF